MCWWQQWSHVRPCHTPKCALRLTGDPLLCQLQAPSTANVTHSIVHVQHIQNGACRLRCAPLLLIYTLLMFSFLLSSLARHPLFFRSSFRLRLLLSPNFLFVPAFLLHFADASATLAGFRSAFILGLAVTAAILRHICFISSVVAAAWNGMLV
jgi:hypothetical protein